MVQMDGCGRRSPFSSRTTISVALTASYGRFPYVNSSHSVTPVLHRYDVRHHGNADRFLTAIKFISNISLQCIGTVSWATGRASGLYGWSFARLIDPDVTTTSIVLSSTKIG